MALEAVGAGLLVYGYSKDSEASRNHKEYMAAETQEDIDRAKSKGKDSESTRNTSYMVGTLFLAAGIGIYIWF